MAGALCVSSEANAQSTADLVGLTSLIQRVGAPTLSPDGALACAAVTRYDMERNEGDTSLWLFPTRLAGPRRAGGGLTMATEPKYLLGEALGLSPELAQAADAAMRAVTAPIPLTTRWATGGASINNGVQRATMYTPAVTIVAA